MTYQSGARYTYAPCGKTGISGWPGFQPGPTEKGVLDLPDLDGAEPPPDPDVDVNEGCFRHISWSETPS